MTARTWTMDDVDTIVELPGVYDGWSIAILKDGTAVNRWNATDYPVRHAATERALVDW